MAVVVPAHNEERLIEKTICPVPSVVDAVYVVDDGSRDSTSSVVSRCAEKDPRIHLIRHQKNRGAGAAIITGYRRAFKDGHDIFVVVGGDAQMDWNDLDRILEPIRRGDADYTKGNRFMYGKSPDCPGNAWREMPPRRILGNVTLSILTKIASGYYRVNDSQMGYTAMHRRVFPLIDWDRARKGYGYPAEWLMRFHSKGFRVQDVPVRAVYLENERQTQIRVRKFLFYMLGIIIKGGLARVQREYLGELYVHIRLPKVSIPPLRPLLRTSYSHMKTLRPLLRTFYSNMKIEVGGFLFPSRSSPQASTGTKVKALLSNATGLRYAGGVVNELDLHRSFSPSDFLTSLLSRTTQGYDLMKTADDMKQMVKDFIYDDLLALEAGAGKHYSAESILSYLLKRTTTDYSLSNYVTGSADRGKGSIPEKGHSDDLGGEISDPSESTPVSKEGRSHG